MTFRPAESIYTYISPNDAETLTPPLALCLAARFDVNGVLRGVRHSLMRKCGSVRSCGALIHDRGGDLLLLVAGGLSRGDLVLVRESAEDLFPADPVPGEVDLRRPGGSLSRGELAEGAVRPGGVVVHHVPGQHPPQVVLICDQQPAGQLSAQGADHLFADRVRSRRLRRAGGNPDALRREHGAGGAGELAGAIPDQEPG